MRKRPSNSPRQSRHNRLRWAAFLLLHAAIAIHLYLWYGLGWRGFGAIDFQELFRAALEKNLWTIGALLFAVLILFGLLWGRFFCGWLCHIGQVYDLLEPLAQRWGLPRRRLRLRGGIWFSAAILVWYFAHEAIAHRLSHDSAPFQIELAETAPWELLPGWIQGSITLLLVWLVLPIVLGPRPFCRSLCPWGALFGITQPLALLKVRRSGNCTLCGRCDQACPMDIDVSRLINRDFHVAQPDCTNCLACVASCPTQALSWSLPKAENRAPRPEPPAPEPRALSLPAELGFWLLVALVGLTYAELYGIGIFLAYSMGLLLASFSIEWLPGFRAIPLFKNRKRLARHSAAVALSCLWLITAKDAWAHHSYRQANQAWLDRQPARAQILYERCDRLFWVSPNLLFYRLYTIYKETGQTEKARKLYQRYESRRSTKGEPPAR